MRTVIGWKSVLYESIQYRAELKLSRRLPNCTMSDFLRDFSLVFFSLIEIEISEQASRQITTEEPKKVCKHTRRLNWRYYKVSRDENPQRVNEMDGPSFEGFHT